jgi:hypothetical protein
MTVTLNQRAFDHACQLIAAARTEDGVPAYPFAL